MKSDPGGPHASATVKWKAAAIALLVLSAVGAVFLFRSKSEVSGMGGPVQTPLSPSLTEALRQAFPPPQASAAQKTDQNLKLGPTLAEQIAGALQPTQPPAAGTSAPQEFSWEPLDVFFGHLFPCIEVARPTRGATRAAQELGPNWLGDYPNSPYSAQVISPAGKRSVRLEISCDELMEPSFSEVVIDKAGLWAVSVRVKWNFKALRQCTQVHPVNVVWTLSVDGKSLPSQTRTVIVQPVDVMPLSYASPTGRQIDCTHFLAAYANEDHPLLDGILKEALETHVVSSFDGLLSDDPNQVLRQVLAIWWALQKRGVVYSNITGPAVSTNGPFVAQRVRFFDDAIQSRQANCVDGTLVFASLLRRIGLLPLICITPGHAFLGFRLDRNGQKTAYLETTALNDRSYYVAALKSLSQPSGQLQPAAPVDLGPDWLTCPATPQLAEAMFVLALNRGVDMAREAVAKQQQDSKSNPFFQIDLDRERSSIFPIPSELRN